MIFKYPTSFFVLILVFIGLLFFAIVFIDQSIVRNISIVGSLNDRQLASIEDAFSGIDISSVESDQIDGALNELNWVHHANIRKSWPQTIEVEIFPESVIAYWNDKGFINKEGSVLYTNMLLGGDLPHLYGPSGSERQVMEQYQQLSQMLNNYGYAIKVLSITEMQSWSLETESGVEVLLGREDLKARMQRFLAIIETLAERGDKRFVKRIDARYINGVAIDFGTENTLQLAELNKPAEERNL